MLNEHKKQIQRLETPIFIYNKQTLLNNIERIKTSIKKNDLKNKVDVCVSFFANSNPHLFQIIEKETFGAVLQTKEELFALKKFNLSNIKKIVSPTILSKKGYLFFLKKDIPVNIGALDLFKFFVKDFKKAGLRIDISKGQNQKTGIKFKQLQEIKNFLKNNDILFDSIHIYPGTGSSMKKILKSVEKIFKIYNNYFKNHVKKINLGGGFNYSYDKGTADEKHFDWDHFFSNLKKLCKKYSIPSEIKFEIEPGRDILADVGEFLVRVEYVDKLNKIVYTDGSYVYMPSATIRKRKHLVDFLDSNLVKIKPKKYSNYMISGCTTLSSDFLFSMRIKVPKNIKIGDYLLVKDIGAYGATQHLEFLNKTPAVEILIDKNNLYEISKRGDNYDKWRNIPSQIKIIK